MCLVEYIVTTKIIAQLYSTILEMIAAHLEHSGHDGAAVKQARYRAGVAEDGHVREIHIILCFVVPFGCGTQIYIQPPLTPTTNAPKCPMSICLDVPLFSNDDWPSKWFLAVVLATYPGP